MDFKFYYDESNPTLESYKELLNVLEKMSTVFFSQDKILCREYDYEIMLEYERKKREYILKMFDKIIAYFPVLNNIPCAIYLNGSYARKSITAGSDVDLTFYFRKKDVSKYQTLVYLIRNAISKMLNVNVVHVHSFTKNFVTEFRKKNNLVVTDQNLKTTIIWTSTGEKYNIDYPKNQMISEREICEISSIKNMENLEQLYKNQITNFYPKEWIYTHECIHYTDDDFLIYDLIKRMDSTYNEKERKIALYKIRNEVEVILEEVAKYYENLTNCEKVELADFNMIGKRKVTMLIHEFATYLRWYYIDKGQIDIPLTLDLNKLFNYENSLIDKSNLDDLNNAYYYFRFLISRVEIWVKEFNHHFEHRSIEIIEKKLLNSEYMKLWGKNYLPIEEQYKAFNHIKNSIRKLLKAM